MAKLTSQFVTEIRQRAKEKEKQNELRQKYNLEENITVIEKTNYIKTLVNMASRILKVALTITLLSLASVGLLAIIYPSTRNELIIIFENISTQISTFLFLSM